MICLKLNPENEMLRNIQYCVLPGCDLVKNKNGGYFNIAVSRVGLGIIWGFFRYRCQIDTFKTVPVPEPILIYKKKIIN